MQVAVLRAATNVLDAWRGLKNATTALFNRLMGRTCGVGWYQGGFAELPWWLAKPQAAFHR